MNQISLIIFILIPKSCFAQTGSFPLHFFSAPKLVLDSSKTHDPEVQSQQLKEKTEKKIQMV